MLLCCCPNVVTPGVTIDEAEAEETKPLPFPDTSSCCVDISKLACFDILPLEGALVWFVAPSGVDRMPPGGEGQVPVASVSVIFNEPIEPTDSAVSSNDFFSDSDIMSSNTLSPEVSERLSMEDREARRFPVLLRELKMPEGGGRMKLSRESRDVALGEESRPR